MEGPEPEQFANYLKESDPNNDHECVSLGWETFIKKDSLFKEFPQMLQKDLGFPKGMASLAMGELLQILKEIEDIRNLKREEFVESWLYHQIGQFFGLTIGDLFKFVYPKIKRICKDDWARQQQLQELCSQNKRKKNYQDFCQKIQKSSIYSQLHKPPSKNGEPSQSQLQSQVLLIQNMHRYLREEWEQVKENSDLVEHMILRLMLANLQSRNHKDLEKTPFKQSQRNVRIQELDELALKIKDEGSMSKQAQIYFDNCKQFSKDKDINSYFYDNLEALKKQISIVDDFLLKKLMEETKKQNVQKKDIIFLIGPTGAGKTTLILWLLGYKMVFKKWGQFTNLTPEGQTKPEHQALLANPGSNSVTRFIYSTKLPYPGRSQLQICDSPGFFDSASTEVDIVNGIGMINAIKRCKSVKPVIVFNGMGLGNRYSEVKNLGKIVSKLFSVSDLTDVKQNIQFIFNKFTKDGFKEFRAGVKSIIRSLTAVDQGDVKYVGFLKHLDETLDKSEDPNVRLVFTPESKDISRQKWIKKLRQSPVTYPEEIFQYSYSSQSKQKIEKAAQRLSKRIISYINSDYFGKNIKNVLYYFRKLSRIYDIVTGDIKHIYQQIVKNLKNHYQQLFDRFSKYLKDQVLINEANTKTFESMKKIKEDAEQFYKIFSKQLRDLENAKKLEQLIREQEKDLQNYFEDVNFQSDMDENKLKMELEVIKKSTCFSNALKRNVKDIFDKKYQQANSQVSQRIATLSFQDFEQAGCRYLKICKWKSLQQDKEEDHYKQIFYDRINKKLWEQKQKLLLNIQKNISQEGKQGTILKIQKMNIDNFKKDLQRLTNLGSCLILEGTNIKQINNQILNKLIGQGENIMNKVVSILHKDKITPDALEQIKILIQNRDKLVLIEEVSAALERHIQNCNDSMRRICQSEEKTISGILENLQDQTLTQNLGAEVARSYERIKSLPSLSKDQAFIDKVSKVEKKLNDDMLQYLSDVIRKIRTLNRFNIGDKKQIQTERIKTTINSKKKIDFFSSFGLFKDQKTSIQQIQKEINDILVKPYDDMKAALYQSTGQSPKPQDEDSKNWNLLGVTLLKYDNFLIYKNTFMEFLWSQQSNALVKDKWRQIIELSKNLFDLFVKPIRQILKIQHLATLCDSDNKKIKFLDRSLNFLIRIKKSPQLAPFLQEQIGFSSQNQYNNVQDFILRKKQELRNLIYKASREQNQKQMVDYLEYVKKLQIFDKLFNNQTEMESFVSLKMLLQSKITSLRQTSVKNFDSFINQDKGLDLKEIQTYYDRFKGNWQTEISTSIVQGTQAEQISGQMVSKLKNYFRNQQRSLTFLLDNMISDPSISLFTNQDTSGYLVKVERFRKQINQILKMFEKEPVKVQFDSYLSYIQQESLIEYSKQLDGQITEIIKMIDQFRLKQAKNRLRRFKQVEKQMRKTIGSNFFDELLANFKEQALQEYQTQQKQRCGFVYEYLEQYQISKGKKRLQILQFKNGSDLLSEGIINIYHHLQNEDQKANFKVRIEEQLLTLKQQIQVDLYLGKKTIDKNLKLNQIMKNIPLQIRSKFLQELETRKKQIQTELMKVQKQIQAKIAEGRLDFQTDIIKTYKNMQDCGADEKLLGKYEGFCRQYFRKQESVLQKTQVVSEFLNIFKSKIITLKLIIYQNQNKLQKIKKTYKDCESKMVLVLSQMIQNNNINFVQNYLGNRKIQDSLSIQKEVKQIFTVYYTLENHLQIDNKYREKIMNFMKKIGKQYEQFIIGWQKEVDSQFECSKKVLIQKLRKYVIHKQVASILSEQIKQKAQFSETYDVLINDKIKEKLGALSQKIQNMIKNICNIKFYTDQLKSMNQTQMTKYLRDYEKDLQRLKKFQQIFVEEQYNFIEETINIEDLQKRIIDQWQTQNSSIILNIKQSIDDFDKSDISDYCNVLDLIFKVVKQKRICPLWKRHNSLNQLPLTKEIQSLIFHLRNKCSQYLQEIIQEKQKTQKDIQQERDDFRKVFQQNQDSEKNENKSKIDKSRTEIQADPSLKPQEKNQNQKIQAITDNIQKLSNEKLREMKLKHESLISSKKNKLIQSQENGLREIALNLVKIKRISLYIRRFYKPNNEWMNRFLKQLGQKNRQRMVNLEKYLRETKAEVEVEMIVNDSGAFAFIKAEIYVRQTKAQDIEYLLREIPQIKQNIREADKYRRQYKYYSEEYSRIQEDYKLDSTSEFKRLLVEEIKKKGLEKSFKKSELIAKIFALWSILKLDGEESEIVFSFNPHPAQIMAILFLINCFEVKEKIKNRFAEVLTGEGKSVVLAGLCSYLAVCGYKTYCACYSEYLSKRDNQEFRTLFQALEILDRVKYGPFHIHCENLLNQEGGKKPFKEFIKQIVINDERFVDKMKQFFASFLSFFDSSADKFTKDKLQKRVLIIDEVDVFFDENFYGQIYRPAITLDSDQIKNLLVYIWQLKKNGKLTIKGVENSQKFKTVTKKYPLIEKLLKNQLNGMIQAAKDPSHSYLVNNQCLCYIDNQSISYDINYGFKTVFANCLQYDRKRVSLSNRDKSLKISLIVGQFSYAELPKYFKSILGVSGTINAIPQYKKTDMRDLYDIKDFISIPSIYRKKVVAETYQIVKNESFDKILSQRIQKVNKENRPVIVFFSGEKEMLRYRSCSEFKDLKSLSYVLSEETANDHRDQIIQRAGQKGVITLITCSFARGTDFKIYEKSVIEAGGLHVIQTYLSMNKSDFIQVKGRTARQGKNGSFEFLLKESDLELLEIKYDERLPIPDQLQGAWKLNDEKIGETYKQKLIKATEKHNENMRRFSENASQAQWIDYIFNLNSYEEIKHHNVRTVIGIDGTGSMSYALRNVLLTIERVVQRISAIVQEQEFNGSQEIEIVIYRNYRSDYDLLLQCSGFESSATKLTEFLRNIMASGGQGNQALEVLFQYINRRENVNQVIVIGDAAPNTPDEVKRKRSIKPEQYWNQHKFPMTTSQDQIKKIIQNKIPIHSFYIQSHDYFQKLSKETGGHSERFVLDHPNTEQSLVGFLSSHILKQLDPDEKLLKIYAEKYKFQKRY